MRRLFSIALGMLLALGQAVPLAAVEGFYLEEEIVKTSGRAERQVERSRTWLAPGRLRKESDPTGSVTIMRTDQARVWVLDTRKGTYFEVQPEALAETAEAAQVLAGDAPSDWLRKTGNRKKVGGFDAYEVRAEDRPVPGATISMWLSKDVPIGRELRDQFRSGLFAGESPAARLLESLSELPGYPVEVILEIRLGAQILEVRQTLKKVERLDIAEGRFELPAGARRVESPFGKPPANP